jgi:two-component system alkaline phosphatase synthesis response regulator PhoP
MARVLLAETDKNLIPLLKAQLQAHGHEVMEHFGCDGLTETVAIAKPALVVIRLASGGTSRLSPVQKLRGSFQGCHLPIIAVQSRVLGDHRYSAYRYNVDDVLTEPFDAKELSLRVAAVLRRTGDSQRNEEKAWPTESAIHIGPITLLPAELLLSVNDKSFPLTRTEMKILLCLAEYPGQPCENLWLQSRVWNFRSKFGSHHIQWHVNHLRKKLGSHGLCIVTIPRVGYMLDSGAVLPTVHA